MPKRPRHEDSREVRKKAFQLDCEIAEKHDNIEDTAELTRLIDKSTQITRQVTKPSDQANASRTFSQLAAVANTQVTQFVRQTTAASPKVLVKQLLAFFGQKLDDDEDAPPDAIDWLRLGTTASNVYRSAPSAQMDCMLGAIEPPKQAQRRETVRRATRTTVRGPVEKPEEMDTKKQDDTNETSKLTEAMFEIINNHGRQPYVYYVLNHESFSQTVENMFSVSMLVGNAKVALVADDEWGMCVTLPDRSTERGKKPVQAQMILNINNFVWNAMKKAVKPSCCLTPHRATMALFNNSVNIH